MNKIKPGLFIIALLLLYTPLKSTTGKSTPLKNWGMNCLPAHTWAFTNDRQIPANGQK